MTEKNRSTEQAAQSGADQNATPKPESTSEYEGAESRKPSGNQPVEQKTETSSSSGE